MSSSAVSLPHSSMTGILVQASEDIAFRSALKYNPDSILDDLEVSSDLKSLLRARSFYPVRAALYGDASPRHVEIAVAVAIYTATTVAVA